MLTWQRSTRADSSRPDGRVHARQRQKHDGGYHLRSSADRPGAANSRREVVGLPAGRREAGDEAGEAGETSV